jgi:predicted alpha/beta superfamily hydrolase
MPAASAWVPVQLQGSQQREVQASASGHRYRVFVAVPPGPAPAGGYPVLYVLDGNAAFPLAALLSRQVASRSEVTQQVAPLVVGIGYPVEEDFDVPARQRDYTPGGEAALGGPVDGGGGADRFLDFIERDLKPLIAAQFAVDTGRQALFGHSFGGLLVLHALFTRPSAFSVYLASSPSIWWRDQAVLAAETRWHELAPDALPRVQITVGTREDEPPPGRLSPELLALLARRTMVEPARSLAARLAARPGASGQVVFQELVGEHHGAAWLPAMARGMQFFVTPADGPAAAPTGRQP